MLDTSNNQVFRAYAFYAGVLVLKTMLMSILTALNRFKKGVFISPEDIAHDPKRLKVGTSDPDVERVRRAHMNDLENVVPFLIVGLLYCFTNPDVVFATLLFKTFTAARIAHTFVYAVYVVRQPARALAFFVAYGVQIYMGYQVVKHFY